MQADFFYTAITAIINKHIVYNQARLFLNELDTLFNDKGLAAPLKMTKMTILFEGFYRSLKDNTVLKDELLDIRLQRWVNHSGIPTLTFLLSYQTQINTLSSTISDVGTSLQLDKDNNVLVDVESIAKINIKKHEATEKFIKTYNPHGGFTTISCDIYSQQFIEYAELLAKKNGKVLEIGAAFGKVTLQAVAKGVTVFCNDISPQNLAVVCNLYTQGIGSTISITGDNKDLVLIPGSFPEELSGLPKESFDAILICRVLHFFSGVKIEESIKQMGSLLKQGGKVFIICETPFLKNWERFLPEYEKRISMGVKWPGEITNPSEYESSGRASSLPPFVHWISKDVLDKSLKQTNLFKIEKSTYINREGQFPDDLLLDGKESVGVVAIKI